MTDTAKAEARCAAMYDGLRCTHLLGHEGGHSGASANRSASWPNDGKPDQIAAEYAALKAVEAAARELVRLQIVDTTEGFDCLLCGPNGHADFCEFHRLKMALAALDAIRKGPDNGKTGEAKL